MKQNIPDFQDLSQITNTYLRKSIDFLAIDLLSINASFIIDMH